MKQYIGSNKFCYLILFVFFSSLTIHTVTYGLVYDDRYLISNFLEVEFRYIFKAMYRYANFHFYPTYFISHLIDNLFSHLFFDFKNYLDPQRWIVPRISNLLYHFISSILLFNLIKKIFKSDNFIPLFSTLIFLSHPLISQPIFNVTSRNELLYLMFGLAAFYKSFSFIEKTSFKNASVFSFLLLLSLCSKALAVFFVFLIPLFHLLKNFSEEKIKQNYESKLIVFIVSIVTLLFFIFLRSQFTKSFNLVIDDNIIYNFLSGLSFYSKSFLIPFEHIYTVVITKVYYDGIFCLILLVALFIYSCFLIYKKREYLLFFTFVWLGSSLAIPIYFGLLTERSFPLLTELAERYAYGSVPAFSFFVAYFLKKIQIYKDKAKFAYPFFGFVLIVFSFLLYDRSKVYQNDEVFWSKAILTHHKDHLYFRIVPGFININKGNYNKALLYLYDNSQVFNNSIRNYTMIAKTYEKMGRTQVSDHFMNLVRERFGGHPMLLMQKGTDLLEEKNFKEAIKNFEMVERIYFDSTLWTSVPDLEKYDAEIFKYEPDDVFFNMGVCYANLGRKEKALEYFKKAFGFNYKHTTAKYNAAVIAKELGNKELAIKLLNEAINQNPKFKFLINNSLKN